MNNKITACTYTPPIGYGPKCTSANVATLQCGKQLCNTNGWTCIFLRMDTVLHAICYADSDVIDFRAHKLCNPIQCMAKY